MFVHPCFLLCVLQCRVLTFKSLILFDDFHLLCEIRLQFYSSACGHPVFITVVEEAILSPLCALDILAEDQQTSCGRIYFQALYFVPLVHVSVFMPAPRSFDYCGFVTYFEMMKCDISTFAFLAQNGFGYLRRYFVVTSEF